MKTSYKVAAAKAEAIHEDGRSCRGTIGENGDVTLRLNKRAAEHLRRVHRFIYGAKEESGPIVFVLKKLVGE